MRETKASLTSSTGRWTFRRTSALIPGVVHPNQLSLEKNKSALHRELLEIHCRSGAEPRLAIQLTRNHTEKEGPGQGLNALPLDFQSVRILEVMLPEVLTRGSSRASHEANSCPPSSTHTEYSVRCLNQQLQWQQRRGCILLYNSQRLS